MHKITPYRHFFWQLTVFFVCVHWESCKSIGLFQRLPFMRPFATAAPADSVSGQLMSITLRFVEAGPEFPNKPHLCGFFLTRGWRLTCHTGWITLAPMTKGVSTTTTKTPPSARVTLVPTDTELMSTTTTINRLIPSVNGQRVFFVLASPLPSLWENTACGS